ncbi:MAG: glycerol-3-phosphate acyltransferase [Ignavibacteriae bacterium]|nr:glycerol-3-phosphate acyltransferase [Ignavibacteriota bacterium]
MLSYMLAGVVGYLIGSFPTAYLVVKWKSQIDIRTAGSGNVGTLNSYQVTNSRFVGAIVLVIDVVKGLLAVLFIKQITGTEFVPQALTGVCAVLGHDFPIWLRFKGGRGLATAAGVMLAVSWFLVVLWMLLWFVGKKISHDINVGNAFATLALLLLVVVAPASLLVSITPQGVQGVEFLLFVAVLVIVIMTKLVEPVRAFFSN